jgi:hypothetical protein
MPGGVLVPPVFLDRRRSLRVAAGSRFAKRSRSDAHRATWKRRPGAGHWIAEEDDIVQHRLPVG